MMSSLPTNCYMKFGSNYVVPFALVGINFYRKKKKKKKTMLIPFMRLDLHATSHTLGVSLTLASTKFI